MEAYARDEAQEGELRVGLRAGRGALPGRARLRAADAVPDVRAADGALAAPARAARPPRPRPRRGRAARRGGRLRRAGPARPAGAVEAGLVRPGLAGARPGVRALARKGRGYGEEDKAPPARAGAGAAARDPARRIARRPSAAGSRSRPRPTTTRSCRCWSTRRRTTRRTRARRCRAVPPSGGRARPDRAGAARATPSSSAARPDGVWPSEGSVSDEVVGLAARGGVRWLASDEGVLERSLGVLLERHGDGALGRPDLLYVPWVRRTADGDVRLLFRDRTLSDLIGFVYSRWPPEAAAADLLARLRAVGADVGGGPAARACRWCRSSWTARTRGSTSADGGRVFLRALYRGLQDDPALEALTVAEALALTPARELPRVFAGSWIGADFRSGSATRTIAAPGTRWARRATRSRAPGEDVPADALARAWEAYRVGRRAATGAGGTATTARRQRRRLRPAVPPAPRGRVPAVGLEPPDALRHSFITTRPRSRRSIAAPRARVTPVARRRVTSGGRVGRGGPLRAPQAGSMARGAPGVRAVRFGADAGLLYVLVEMGESAARDARWPRSEIRLDFGGPRNAAVSCGGARGRERRSRCERRDRHGLGAGTRRARRPSRTTCSRSRSPGGGRRASRRRRRFRVSVWQSGVEMERHPDGAAIEITAGDRRGGRTGHERHRFRPEGEPGLPAAARVRRRGARRQPRGVPRAVRAQPGRPRGLLGRAGRRRSRWIAQAGTACSTGRRRSPSGSSAAS